jgi:hypothetical protein
MKNDESKTPTTVHDPLGIIYHPKEKTITTGELFRKPVYISCLA